MWQVRVYSYDHEDKGLPAWWYGVVRFVDKPRNRLYLHWDQGLAPFGDRQWVSCSREAVMLEDVPVWCRFRGPKEPYWPSVRLVNVGWTDGGETGYPGSCLAEFLWDTHNGDSKVDNSLLSALCVSLF